MREQKLWSLHVLAGVLIAFLLGTHMLVMHLDRYLHLFNPVEGTPIAWENVAFRSGQPWFVVFYIALLGLALYHGLYGLRNILFELSPQPALKKAIGVLFVIFGATLFALGSWAAIVGCRVAQAG